MLLSFGVEGGEGGGAADDDGSNSSKNDGGGNPGDNPDNSKDKNGRDWSDNTNQNPGDDGKGGNQEGGDGEGGKFEMDKLPDSAQKYIKELRSENANHRTKARGSDDELTTFKNAMKSALGLGDEDQVSPEEQVKSLTSQSQDLAFTNSVLSLSIEHGLGTDQNEFLQFLIGKEVKTLEENQELSEEVLSELIAKAKGSGGKAQGSGNTSVDDDGTPAPGGNSETMSAQDFASLNLVRKTELKSKNPNLYSKLFAEAVKLRLI